MLTSTQTKRAKPTKNKPVLVTKPRTPTKILLGKAPKKTAAKIKNREKREYTKYSADVKTEWYDGLQTPKRVGVYERELRSGYTTFSTWNGKDWLLGDDKPKNAARRKSTKAMRSEFQLLPWRGVTFWHRKG